MKERKEIEKVEVSAEERVKRELLADKKASKAPKGRTQGQKE